MSHKHGLSEISAASLMEEIEEDPEQIRAKIEKLISATPPPMAPLLGATRENLVPVLAIVAAALVIAAVVMISLFIFRTEVSRAESEIASYVSGEGLVLAEFRRETEEQLREKDQTIIAALNQLNTLESERRDLDQLVSSRVAQRETELVSELEQRLEEERQKLVDDGASEDAVAQRIDEIRFEGAASIVQSLESFRRGVEADVGSRSSSLLAAEEQIRTTLDLATEERSRLIDEALDTAESLSRSTSDTLAALDQVARESIVIEVAGQSADERVAELEAQYGAQLSAAREIEDDLRSQLAGREQELSALRRALESDDGRAELAQDLARAEGQNATLTNELSTLRDRNEDFQRTFSEAARDTETLREQINDLRDSLASAEQSVAESELRVGNVAQQARTQALRDVVATVKQIGDSTDVSALAASLGPAEPDRSISRQLVADIESLIAEGQREVLSAQLQYRAVGTVLLVSEGSVAVQPLVTIAISEGSLAEIRRTLSDGSVAVVARGVVADIESQRFTVRISETEDDLTPSVSDRVFVAVPR